MNYYDTLKFAMQEEREIIVFVQGIEAGVRGIVSFIDSTQVTIRSKRERGVNRIQLDRIGYIKILPDKSGRLSPLDT